MASRNYSSTAGKMSLVGAISAAATTLIVDATTGLPGALPYVLMIDPGLSTEEIVDVTSAGGTTLTVSRGVDGSPAQAHLTGSEVRHAYSARDFRESRDHEAATLAHGATGAVVGSTNAQTLTNKAISGATNTISSLPKGALPGDITYTDTAQTLTNKVLSGATNTFSGIPSSAVTGLDASKTTTDAHAASTAAHGATGAVVGTTNAQTLSGKSMDGLNNTFTNIPSTAITGGLGAPFAQAAGTVYFDGIWPGTPQNISVGFPGSRFTVAPIVTCTGGASSRLTMIALNVTTAGFTYQAGDNSTSSASAGVAYWTAIQMTAGSAAG